MATTKLPSKQWIRSMDKFYADKHSEKIKSELENRSDLMQKLGDKIYKFILWAGKERLSFEPNLEEEVHDFLKIPVKTRTNGKQ